MQVIIVSVKDLYEHRLLELAFKVSLDTRDNQRDMIIYKLKCFLHTSNQIEETNSDYHMCNNCFWLTYIVWPYNIFWEYINFLKK